MKKFSLILAMILCVLTFGFTLSACKEEKAEFWLDTSTTFDEFLTKEIQEKGYVEGFDFSALDQQFTNTPEIYAQIEDVYQPIWTVQVSYLTKYAGLLKVTPKETSKKAKKAFKNLSKNIATVKEQLNTFATVDVPKYIADIKNHTDTSNLLVHNDTRNFTRKYIDLSSSLLNLTKELTSIYTTYYEDIKTLKNGDEFVELSEVELETYTRIASTKSMTSTLTAFIDYINNYNGEYEQIETDHFMDAIELYIATSNIEHISTAQKLYAWQQTYAVFDSEHQNFNTALKNVTMEKFKTKFDYDVNAYATEYKDNMLIAHVNKIYEFTSNAVDTLKNVTNDLYN